MSQPCVPLIRRWPAPQQIQENDLRAVKLSPGPETNAKLKVQNSKKVPSPMLQSSGDNEDPGDWAFDL
jgi:hypothetical protein